MRRLISSLLGLTLIVGACATISDNITVDVDGIIASTCTQLADKFADELAEALVEFDASVDVDIPDIDVASLIDRAEALGCSPEDMRQLVSENLERVEATSDQARQLLNEVQSELDAGS